MSSSPAPAEVRPRVEFEEHIREVVAAAPTLTREQVDRIAAILRGGAA